MKFFLTSVFMLTTHVFVGYYLVIPLLKGPFCWWTIPVVLLLGGVVVLTFLLGIVFFHISVQPVSKFHSLSSALLQYVFEYGMLRSGRAVMKKLTAVSERPREYQEVLLKQWLKENKDTVYGKKFKFSEVKNLKHFQEKHPLTDYEHYKSFIQDIADGKRNVLTNEPPCRLSLTSGTTGEAKMLPVIGTFVKEDYTEIGGMASAISKEAFPEWSLMQRRIWLYCDPTMKTSKGGIPVGPLSSIPEWARNLLVIYATPADGFRIGSSYEATYIHLLFGLRDRGVSVILAGFSTSLLSAMQLLEEEWEQLVEDLSSGTLSSKLNLDAEVRRNLERALGNGDPKRASELTKEFEKGFDGIIRRVWPDMAFIMAIDIANLKATLTSSYAKDVVIYSHCYGATEGIIGMNITPLEVEENFVLTPTYTIYEFILEKDMTKPNPKTCLIDEVDVGKNYEIVVTTKSGLCRFRFGDVVKITGYHKDCPKVKFLYRSGSLLNMCGEKINQAILVQALTTAVKKWPRTELLYYAVAESTLLSGAKISLEACGDEETRPHYVFFLELKMEEDETVEELKKLNLSEQLDKSLCRHDDGYRHFRSNGQIGNPCVFVTSKGSFGRLHNYILENSSATANQLKIPQKLRTLGMVEFMLTERQEGFQKT